MEHSRTLGILRGIPSDYLGVDKVRNFKVLNNLWSACDALDFCMFASAPTLALTLNEMTAIVAEESKVARVRLRRAAAARADKQINCYRDS